MTSCRTAGAIPLRYLASQQWQQPLAFQSRYQAPTPIPLEVRLRSAAWWCGFTEVDPAMQGDWQRLVVNTSFRDSSKIEGEQTND